jgi:hypothetical protein
MAAEYFSSRQRAIAFLWVLRRPARVAQVAEGLWVVTWRAAR